MCQGAFLLPLEDLQSAGAANSCISALCLPDELYRGNCPAKDAIFINFVFSEMTSLLIFYCIKVTVLLPHYTVSLNLGGGIETTSL